MANLNRTFFYFLFISYLFLSSSLDIHASSNLTVTFLDVGEGEAIYIETPSDNRILIDTGNPITAKRIVDFLNKKGVDSLDAVFITHPHLDHMGGIFHLLPIFNVKSVYDNGQQFSETPKNDIYHWYQKAARKGNYSPVAAGDVFQYGDVKIKVLWPQGPASSDWNSNSLVLKVVYGDIALLLMGDATALVEKALLDKSVDLKAQVLKVGHHGSDDATTKEFLKAVSPDFAVISVNKGNAWGFPADKVVERLKSMRIKTLLTYEHGNVVFTMKDKKGGLLLF